jgi:5S rRNA maturation endonuclease (ribonuclease M5)
MDTKSKEELKSKLVEAGATFKGDTSCTCPFHRDRNPSAGIYQADSGSWRFKCLVCSDNMDILGIESRLTGMPVEEIIRPIERKAPKIMSEEQIRESFSAVRGFRYLHEYLSETGEITHFVACRYNADGGKQFFQLKRYGFNFVVGNSGKRPLFRLDKLKDAKIIVIVEGEKCVYALESVGIDYATTCMGGAKSVSAADLSPLRGKRVIVWPDNDSVGGEYASDLKKALESIDCTVGILNPESFMLGAKEDAHDFIERFSKDYKPEEIKEEIEGILSEVKIDGYWEVLSAGRLQELRDGSLKSFSIGWPCLNQTKWLLGGTVTIVCAPPGIGKTWFVHDLSFRAMSAGIKVANIQLEENKDYHATRIMSSITGANLDPDEVTEADLDIMEAHKHLVEPISAMLCIPDFKCCTLVDIAKIIKDRAEAGARLIIVDSVSVAEKSVRPFDDDQRFINICRHEVSKYKLRLILVTHPKSGQSKAIGLDSLAGGATYQRLAQSVLWISKNEKVVNAWKDTEHPFFGSGKTANRVITCLKGRNISKHMESNKILFSFEAGRYNEIGFCDSDEK